MATGHEFTNLADLASARVGGTAIATNDDFFAPKSNLVKAGPAMWIPDKYTSKGKWMDGWESRRRRVPGHDWCIVQLGMRGSCTASTSIPATSPATFRRIARSKRST